ncbi:MAG: hypothetical protein DYG98_22800 [Haliscomenobacteraceae bacterium CHB4]|nr:hypothetical protein [Saprospiraceae bacterium]MCE7925888.1 hypothetical protein [Haliscomenobacteraceae bacterium CHB4]
MNTKVLLAALAGGVTSFLLGWVFYGILLGDFFAANVGSATGVMKDEASMGWIPLIVGNLATGLLFAMIYNRWAGITTFRTGAIGGAWVGFLIGLSYDMVALGTTNIMNSTAALVDPLVWAVMSAITGGVVGWALGYGNRA